MLRHGLGREDAGGCRRIGGRPGPRRRPADRRPGRQRDHRRGHRGGPGGADVNQADLIWMNGELVAFEDAKVHVLTHALHYGTGVFEGVRAYETPRGTGDLPPRRPHRPALPVGRDVLHGHPVLQGGDPGRDARDDRPQRPEVLLHPPARLPRRRPDGPVPARLPGRGRDRGLGVGRLPRRRGQAERRPRARSPRGGASPPTR